MVNSRLEVPNELRDFAERSVEQARKAFEGFVMAAQKAAGSAEGAANEVQTGAKDAGMHILGFTVQNVNAVFDVAQKLVQAKDPQEAITVQSEFLKTQLNTLQSQAKDLGALIQTTVTKGAKKAL